MITQRETTGHHLLKSFHKMGHGLSYLNECRLPSTVYVNFRDCFEHITARIKPRICVNSIEQNHMQPAELDYKKQHRRSQNRNHSAPNYNYTHSLLRTLSAIVAGEIQIQHL